MENQFTERLYILMRNDMDSLNPGKGMAQAAHAANHFTDKVKLEFVDDSKTIHYNFIKNWLNQTSQGFGTTIVLGAKISDIEELVKFAVSGDRRLYGDMIIDPTYPLLDGQTLHTFPCYTCGWIFVGSSADNLYMDRLFKQKGIELYP